MDLFEFLIASFVDISFQMFSTVFLSNNKLESAKIILFPLLMNCHLHF